MYNYRIVGFTDNSRIIFGTISTEDEEDARVAALSIATALEQLTHCNVREVRAENVDELTFFYSKVYDKETKERYDDPNANP